MNNYAIILKLMIVFLLCANIEENREPYVPFQQRPKKKTQLNQGQKLLSEARGRMRKKRNAPRKEMATPGIEETKKMAKLYQKLSYQDLEIKQFLEIKPESFKNNAELSQLYHETLFSIMEREPKKFVKNTLNISDVRRKIMDRQMKSPIGDNVNIRRINDKLQQEVKTQWKVHERQLRSNDKQVLTKEYNKYESLHRIFRVNNQKLKEPRKLIQLRREEVIRSSVDRVQPVIERRSDTIPRR